MDLTEALSPTVEGISPDQLNAVNQAASQPPPGAPTPAFLPSMQGEQNSLQGKQINQAQIATFRKQWANDPNKVITASEFATYYPHMDPKTIMSLVNGGYNTTDAITQFAADTQSQTGMDKINKILTPPKKQSHTSFWSDPIGWAKDEIAKPAIRGLTLAAETPLQLAEGNVRLAYQDFQKDPLGTIVAPLGAAERLAHGDVEGALRNVSRVAGPMSLLEPLPSAMKQTTLGQAVQNGKDLGTGFFPAGAAAQAQAQASRQVASIDGHAFTPGRFWASQANQALRLADVHIMEPGSRPYSLLSGMIDAGTSWGADPGAQALQDLGAAREAAKTFSAIGDASTAAQAAQHTAQNFGLINAVRRSVIPQTGEEFLQSPSGSTVLQKIAQTSDPYEIWQRSGKQIPVDYLQRFADATTPQDVMDIAREGIHQGDITGPFSLAPHATYQARTLLNKSRTAAMLTSMMPQRSLTVNDPDNMLQTWESALKGAHLDQPTLHDLMNQMIRVAPTRDPGQIKDVAFNGAAAVANRVLDQTGNADLAHQITGLFRKTVDDAWQSGRAYFVDESGRPGYNPIAHIDGNGNQLASPHLLTEFLNHDIPLWNYQDVRDATATLARLYTSQPYQIPRALVNHLTNFWALTRILRPALLARITGESQMAMGASGLTNELHPLQYAGILAGDDGKLGSILRKVGVTPRYTSGVEEPLLGDAAKSLNDGVNDLNRALTHGAGNYLSQKVMPVDWYTTMPTDTPEGMRGWVNELHQLHGDPVTQAVANAANPDDVKQAFWDGNLSWARNLLIRRGAVSLAGRTGDEGADAYIDSLFSRIQAKTGGDSRLVDAVRTGKVGDEPLSTLSMGGREVVNQKALDALQAIRDEGVGPDQVKVGLNWATRQVQGHGENMGAMWDRGTNWLFSHIVGQPDNVLNRSPGIRQLYWNEYKRYLPFATEDAQQRVLNAMDGAGLPDALKTDLRAAASRGTGDLEFNDLRQLAKGSAVDKSHDIFHDLSSRSQFFEGMRAIFPFGDAWRTMLGRWSKLFVSQPNVIHRVDQMITAAKAHDPFVDLGLTAPHQGGFFHQDRNGNEVFTLPGSQWISNATAGVPVPLDAPVKGLNLLAEGLPGFGPGVTFPASALIPSTPAFDWVRNKLIPYGDKHITSPSDVASEVLPSFMQKLMNWQGHPISQRQFNNAVTAAGNYLLSTGKYKTSGPNAQAEMSRLVKDATSSAKQLWLIRGLAQATSPSSPTFDFLTRDKTGGLVAQDLMKQRFQQIENITGDPQVALESFVHEFGPNAFYTVRPVTRLITANLPATHTAANWAASNPDLAKKFPLVYGFFAPQAKDAPDNDFSQTEYQRQIDAGERQALTPEQVWRLANRSIAQVRYDFYRNQVMQASNGHPTRQQRQWLDQWKAQLMNDYPGFNDDTGLTAGPPARDLISQIATAVKDPRLAGTEAGQGLVQYLTARGEAMRILAGQGHLSTDGVTFPSGAIPDQYKVALSDFALQLMAQYPQFANVYDFVFKSDQPTQQASGTPTSEIVPGATG